MLKSYLKIALRTLRSHLGFTVLNVVGLTLGVAAALLITLYVSYQLSYDDFHADADRIYRVRYDLHRDGALSTSSSTTFAAVGPAAQQDFAEVEAFVRVVQRFGGGVVRQADRVFRENKVLHADPNFFSFFSYPLVQGDPATVLAEPNTVVLSTEAARRYFGDDDPIGRRLTFNEQEEYTVTGVAAVPENSHLTFDFLFSYPSLVQVWGEAVYTSWTWWDFRTYVRLRPGIDPRDLEARFPAFIDRYRETADNERIVLSLQPLREIHLYSDLLFELRANGNATTVYALAAIALFILVLAWINYINLSTARAMKRAREIGVRKVLGARRRQLVGQFVFESLLLNTMAGGAALILVQLVLPVFNHLADASLQLGTVASPSFWAGFVGVFLFGAVCSALYPAFVLSAFRPITVLKGRVRSLQHGKLLRQGLVIGQFTLSIALIIGTLVIARQLAYMQQHDLGVDLEQTVVLDLPSAIPNDAALIQRFESFKQQLRQQPYGQQAALSSEVPGSGDQWVNPAQPLHASADERIALYVVAVDYDYLAFYGPALLAGRLFSTDFTSDEHALVLNEEAVRLLRLGSPEQAVGEQVLVRQDTLTVVGVVANHHQRGLDRAIYQIGYRLVPEEWRYLSVRLPTAALPDALASLEGTFEPFFPALPLTYRFADQLFAAQYRAYRQFGRVFALFAGLAIAIACLGLFGLAAFMAEQRTKEIGIRKVFGASVAGLVALLTTDFLKLVALAFVVAVPIAYGAMQQWLEAFAYRIELGVEVFVLAGVLSAAIALATVSYQAVRAALANPVKSLRYE